MLLSHQASINDFGLRPRNIPYILLYSRYKQDYTKILKKMLETNRIIQKNRYFLNYPPGEKAQYCELGFIIAGYLVERISNKTLEEYCQKKHI